MERIIRTERGRYRWYVVDDQGQKWAQSITSYVTEAACISAYATAKSLMSRPTKGWFVRLLGLSKG